MNLEKRLLVCESMLARLDAALAHADEELASASIVEAQIGGRLADLIADQERLIQKLRSVNSGLEGDPAREWQEPFPAFPQETSFGETLLKLRAAQETLMRAIDRNRPSGRVIRVDFERGKRYTARTSVPGEGQSENSRRAWSSVRSLAD